MDLRERKTRRAISNAFLELRSHKPLERITIKELTELAEISKATFYLHYKDIYDLSEQMQNEIIDKILDGIKIPELVISNPAQFIKELIIIFVSYQSIIDILFSGTQEIVLPLSIERKIKEYIFELMPEKRNDAHFNTLLTYKILGGYYAYAKNEQKYGGQVVIDVLEDIESKNRFEDLYQGTSENSIWKSPENMV